jgi:hypothetical protein
MTSKFYTFFIPLSIFLFFTHKTAAQDLESITKQKPVVVSGSIGLSANSYHSTVLNQGNSPFGYALNGNVNISLYGLYNIPISVFMTNLSRGASSKPIPLANLGFTPTFKNFTFYAGWSSVQWSSYTLAGAPFVGGGVEWKNKWLKLGAVYGTFQKAYGDTLALENPLGYKRQGLGLKLGFGGERSFIDFTAFKAKDDSLSLNIHLTQEEARPKENLAFGSQWRTGFLKNRLSWDGEIGVSALSSDLAAPILDLNELAPKYASVQKLFQPRLSMAFYYAGATSLGWQSKKFQVKMQYRHVSKDFKSLGAVYVQNNLENYTLSTNFSLWKNRLRFNAQGGIQHDELPLTGLGSVGVKDRLLLFATAGAYAKKLQINMPVFTYRRIGSASMSFNPTQVYGLDFSFSNFLTDQQISKRLLFDTARTAQATTSMMVMNRLTFTRPNIIHNIIAVYNYSVFDNNVGNARIITPNGNNTVGNLNYSANFPKKKLTTNISSNYSRTVFGANPITYFGGMVGGSKTLLKGKMSLGANLGYGVNQTATGKSGNVNFSFNTSFNPFPRQSLNASIIMLNNKAEQAINPNIGEFRGNIAYTYSF